MNKDKERKKWETPDDNGEAISGGDEEVKAAEAAPEGVQEEEGQLEEGESKDLASSDEDTDPEAKNKSSKKSAEKTSIFFRKNPDTIPIKIKRRNGT